MAVAVAVGEAVEGQALSKARELTLRLVVVVVVDLRLREAVSQEVPAEKAQEIRAAVLEEVVASKQEECEEALFARRINIH